MAVRQKSGSANVAVGAIGVSAAVFAAYFAVLATEFGRELRVHGVAKYAAAFAFPLVPFAATIAALEMFTKDSGPGLSQAITFLTCYSGLNCITMVRNVLGIVRLWQEVERSNQKDGDA